MWASHEEFDAFAESQTKIIREFGVDPASLLVQFFEVHNYLSGGRSGSRRAMRQDEGNGSLRPSLAEEQGQLTRSRIRQAAMEILARRGFDATVEDITKVSGISPRTIFRQFGTQADLIYATVKDMFDAVGHMPIAGLPEPADDLDGWLEVVAVTVHTRNAEIIGNAFWDLHGPKIEESDKLAPVAALRRSSRLRGVKHLAKIAWREAGGEGKPPEALVSAFALNFSAFATQALMIDFEHIPAQIGALTADILKVLLRRAVDAQRSERGGDTTEAQTDTD